MLRNSSFGQKVAKCCLMIFFPIKYRSGNRSEKFLQNTSKTSETIPKKILGNHVRLSSLILGDSSDGLARIL